MNTKVRNCISCKKDFNYFRYAQDECQSCRKKPLSNKWKNFSVLTRQNMEDNWTKVEYQKKRKDSQRLLPNKKETKLLELLNKFYPDSGWRYVGDFSLWIGHKNPDFISSDNTLIELYGDYWHKGEDPNERIKYFENYGYKCVVIWERELKETKKLKKTIDELLTTYL